MTTRNSFIIKVFRHLQRIVQDRALDMEVRLQPYTQDPFDQPTHVVRSKLHVGPLVHLISQLNKKIKIWGKSLLKSTASSKKKRSAALASLPEISCHPVPPAISCKAAMYRPGSVHQEANETSFKQRFASDQDEN